MIDALSSNVNYIFYIVKSILRDISEKDPILLNFIKNWIKSYQIFHMLASYIEFFW